MLYVICSTAQGQRGEKHTSDTWHGGSCGGPGGKHREGCGKQW